MSNTANESLYLSVSPVVGINHSCLHVLASLIITMRLSRLSGKPECGANMNASGTRAKPCTKYYSSFNSEPHSVCPCALKGSWGVFK